MRSIVALAVLGSPQAAQFCTLLGMPALLGTLALGCGD